MKTYSIHSITDDEIDTKADELMDYEYSPYRADNLMEAVGGLPEEFFSAASVHMITKNDAAVGRMLRELSEVYWRRHARAAARVIITKEIEEAQFERDLSRHEAKQVAR